MKYAKQYFANFLSCFGKSMFIFIAGGIATHFIVMSIDYLLMSRPLYFDLHDNFFDSVLSMPMLPMAVAYGLLALATYILWSKKKKAIIRMHEKEIQSEKAEAVLKSMQRITGMLAEHIAVHNAKIMGWVESRKRSGGRVSDNVEKSSKKIAQSLQSLSKISFIYPYTENRPENVGDIEKMLQANLHKVTEFQDG